MTPGREWRQQRGAPEPREPTPSAWVEHVLALLGCQLLLIAFEASSDVLLFRRSRVPDLQVDEVGIAHRWKGTLYVRRFVHLMVAI